MRIKVTPRDIRVLLDSYRNTVLSFYQLKRRHFEDRKDVTVSNRLTQLCQAGFLTKHKYHYFDFLELKHKAGVAFQTTSKGQRLLETVFPDGDIRQTPFPLNPNSLVHDLLLNDVLAALSIRFPMAAPVNGRLIEYKEARGGRRPDALLNVLGSSDVVAVELELNAKSQARYREIVVQYLTHNRFSKVLYICASQSIIEKIRYQITQQKRGSAAGILSSGKFYFVLASTVLERSKDVSITSGSIELVVN